MGWNLARGSVLIRGQRAPIVGRVSMNQISVDITRIGAVQSGEEVVIVGTQGEETMSAEELAANAETIGYDVTSGLSPRMKRQFLP